MRRDIGGDLILQRGGQHPPRPLPHDLIQARGQVLGRSLVSDYLQHWRSFPPASARRLPSFDHLGRYAAPSIRSRIHNFVSYLRVIPPVKVRSIVARRSRSPPARRCCVIPSPRSRSVPDMALDDCPGFVTGLRCGCQSVLGRLPLSCRKSPPDLGKVWDAGVVVAIGAASPSIDGVAEPSHRLGSATQVLVSRRGWCKVPP